MWRPLLWLIATGVSFWFGFAIGGWGLFKALPRLGLQWGVLGELYERMRILRAMFVLMNQRVALEKPDSQTDAGAWVDGYRAAFADLVMVAKNGRHGAAEAA